MFSSYKQAIYPQYAKAVHQQYDWSMGEEMKSLADLLPLRRVIPQKGKSERSGLIKYFTDRHFTHRNGTLFTAKQIAVRCSHLTLQELYYIKSVHTDINNRKGSEAAAKYFMGATKTRRLKELTVK